MPSADILSTLSPRQREAVEHLNGPLLIVAGPGSGKTRVMAHRVAYLIGRHNVSPYRILAVTFTNKAARELRSRCQLLVPDAADAIQVRTFHGFCALTLRLDGARTGVETNFTIYDDDDQARLVRNILDEADIDPKRFTPRSILSRISEAKNRMIDDVSFARGAESYFDEIVGRVYTRYVERLQQVNAVDFDDLLLRAHHLLESNPDVLERYRQRYEHLLIDEFQDTNPLQFSLARLLAGTRRNICVVGDPDQSIYSWRHADPRNLLDFQQVYPEARIVTLDQSYRSSQVILEAADAVIANNDERMPKKLWTENARGNQIVVSEAYDEEEEAEMVLQEVDRLADEEGIDRGEVAVMYRINAQSRAMEVACNRRAVPYRLVGGVKFYARKEIKDLLAYLRVTHNPADDVSLERIINTPARGISENTVAELTRAARQAGTPVLDVIFSLDDPSTSEASRFNPRAVKSMKAFGDLMQRLIEQSMSVPPVDLLDLALDRSGYKRLIQEDQERGIERAENILELRGSAEAYSGGDPRTQLSEFLENVALVSEVDEMDRQGDGAITLITLHQAKGLEFDAVFIIGLEEGLLPHSRSLASEDPAQLQEERRLCYVGMTRARRRLYLLRAFQRSFRGTRGATEPSRFLNEVPLSLVSHVPSRRAPARMRRPEPTVRDPIAVKNAATIPAPRSASGPEPEFRAGDRVRHAMFGDGIVVSVKAHPDDAELTVAFDGQGVKRLMLSFSPLERVTPSVATPGHAAERAQNAMADLP